MSPKATLSVLPTFQLRQLQFIERKGSVYGSAAHNRFTLLGFGTWMARHFSAMTASAQTAHPDVAAGRQELPQRQQVLCLFGRRIGDDWPASLLFLPHALNQMGDCF